MVAITKDSMNELVNGISDVLERSKAVIVEGEGLAVGKLVAIVEILKQKHAVTQYNQITSKTVDVEPQTVLEEIRGENRKRVTVMKVYLGKDCGDVKGWTHQGKSSS